MKLGILLLIGLPVAPGVAAANEFVPVPVPITRFDPDVHGFFSTEALADDAEAQLRRRNNPGGNLGELRRNSVQAAATYLTEFLEFKEQVVVDASFEDLAALCDESSGIAAQGVANDARVITFDVEPPLKIVYPIALANTLFGTDLAPANADISVVFNNAVGADDCLSVGWDYSIGVEAVAGVSLFDTFLREMFRGLGFQSYVDLTTGARQIVEGEPVSDIFSFQLVDYGVGLNWHDMTDAQRLTSATGGTLAFGGALSRAQARRLADGFSLPIGQDPLPRMYAPGTLNPLYSVSHFDPSVTPGDLMEPTPDFVIDHTMAAKVLYDLQWPGTLCMNLVVPPYTWVKLSADCDLEGVGTAGTLFRDSAVYQYIEWWVYDSALRRYDRVDSGDPIAAGDAVWLIHSAAEPLHLRMPQASLPQALDVSGQEADCWSLQGCRRWLMLSNEEATATRWQMFGNPYNTDIAFGDVRFRTESGDCAVDQGCSLDEAISRQLITNAWIWKDGRYERLTQNSYWPRNMGFWMGRPVGEGGRERAWMTLPKRRFSQSWVDGLGHPN